MSDVVQDDNRGIFRWNYIGPFESAWNQFHCGQVIHLCAGAFGEEANPDFTRLIKVLMREASASDEGLSISPLVRMPTPLRKIFFMANANLCADGEGPIARPEQFFYH